MTYRRRIEALCEKWDRFSKGESPTTASIREVGGVEKTWPETEAEHLWFRDWQYEVANGDTVLGFRDWIENREAS